MTPLQVLVYAALTGCALAGAIRVTLGPSLGERIAALDVMLVALMSGIAADAGFREDPTNLDLIVVIAIVGFTATVAASRFIERDAPPTPAPTHSPAAPTADHVEADEEASP